MICNYQDNSIYLGDIHFGDAICNGMKFENARNKKLLETLTFPYPEQLTIRHIVVIFFRTPIESPFSHPNRHDSPFKSPQCYKKWLPHLFNAQLQVRNGVGEQTGESHIGKNQSGCL